jgi:UDP-GlcNAc:undecaprenyl-phosphate/decaprenyl-phosphate GlcNAc-1-phosphate transferase
VVVVVPVILVFSVSLAVALLAAPLSIQLGRRWQMVDRPGGRRAHGGVVPRTGGAALFIAFLVGSVLALLLWPPANPDDRRRLAAVLGGTVLVFAFGLWDDWREMPAWPQFIAQGCAALVAVAGTVFIERFTNPLDGQLVVIPDLLPFFGWGIVGGITIFWVVGMVNTVNWLDGLDGLAAGVTFIAASLFAIHSHRLGQPEIALIPTALAGACLGFLPFNFHPARVFMGTAGAMTLGYALATLSILAPARIATALLVLGLPIIDVAWIIVSRWRRGTSAARGGRDHLHYRLLELGLSQRQIVGLYYLFCLLFGALALMVPSPFFKLVALAVLGLGVLVLLWQLSRRTSVSDGCPGQETEYMRD